MEELLPPRRNTAAWWARAFRAPYSVVRSYGARTLSARRKLAFFDEEISIIGDAHRVCAAAGQ
jgi:hypothetical protein